MGKSDSLNKQLPLH